ncbi:MAG: hypothetical protein H6828_04320 [Planctomycetes bacterium]|nr:hypothetical protein [Planctomycetota bacterium]
MIDGRRDARLGGLLGALDRRVALSVFCLLLALYTATFNGPAAGLDAEVSFQTTSALARTGSPALGGTPEADELVRRAREAPPGAFPVRAGVPRDGATPYYGWYGLGQALAALPFYALGRGLAVVLPDVERANASSRRYGTPRSEYFAHLAVGWRTPVCGALTGMLVVLAVLRLGVSRRAGFAAGLAYGVTTYAWPQALGDLSDVQATCCLALAAYALLVLRYHSSRAVAAVLGAAAGCAFLTRAAIAPALVVLDVAFLHSCLRGRAAKAASDDAQGGVRRRLVLAGLAPQLACLALWLAANHLRFGAPLDSGYGEALRGGLFGGDPLRAAAGLLVSPGKGLVWYAPGLVLLWSGARRARGAGRRGIGTFVLLCALAVFLPAALLMGWHGGWTYGPRYLLPALPLLWCLAAVGFTRSSIDLRVRPAAWAAFALGLVVQVPGVLVDTYTHHELAVLAAQERFQLAVAGTAADQEEERFQALQFDWGFAAPWAHWRLLRHRVAGLGEDFPASEVFRYPSEAVLSPTQEREQGFRHLAWVDLEQRLGGVSWPAVGGIVLLLGLGLVLAARALDPS